MNPRHKHAGGHPRFSGRPRFLARRLLGLFLMYSLLYLLYLPPYTLFASAYERMMGHPANLPVKIGLSLVWFALLYVVFFLLIQKIFHNRMTEHRPPNMFDQVLEALDRIAMGDYDVYVKKEEHYHYSELADKVNSLARDLSSVEQMRQEFVSNVSHEIQSPLTSISGFAGLLKKEDLPPEQRRHYVDIIEAESRRLSKLSDNLLKLSMLDSEHTPFSPAPFRLDKQIEGILLMLEPQWSEKEIHLEVSLERVEISGDQELLGQVWINLLHNSVKFTPIRGTISVTLEQVEDMVRCTVADTGCGIPEENLARIFERFYKVDKSRDRSLGGNGLGLSLAKRIVDLHKGKISVGSTVGEGTAFTIALPFQVA